MTWSQPADFVRRSSGCGSAASCCVRGRRRHAGLALRLSLKSPSTADLSNRFDAVRGWVRDISATPCVRIEWREWTHRVQGRQRLPDTLWIDMLEDALAMIGKTGDAHRFQALWQHTAEAQPALLPWLHRSPLQTLALAEHWPRLLAVVAGCKPSAPRRLSSAGRRAGRGQQVHRSPSRYAGSVARSGFAAGSHRPRCGRDGGVCPSLRLSRQARPHPPALARSATAPASRLHGTDRHHPG